MVFKSATNLTSWGQWECLHFQSQLGVGGKKQHSPLLGLLWPTGYALWSPSHKNKTCISKFDNKVLKFLEKAEKKVANWPPERVTLFMEHSFSFEICVLPLFRININSPSYRLASTVLDGLEASDFPEPWFILLLQEHRNGVSFLSRLNLMN